MSSPARTTVVDQLEQEWPALLQHRLACGLHSLALRPAVLAPLRPAQPTPLLPPPAPSAATDEPLLALLILAQDDTAAGRFILQAVLPALKAQAQRLARRGVPHDELLGTPALLRLAGDPHLPGRAALAARSPPTSSFRSCTTRRVNSTAAAGLRTRVELVQPGIVPGRPPLRHCRRARRSPTRRAVPCPCGGSRECDLASRRDADSAQPLPGYSARASSPTRRVCPTRRC